MHELGHNLGLEHASDDGVEYGDQSSYMGYSYGEQYGPRMCFNGPENHLLGWYADRTVDLPAQGGWSGPLWGLEAYTRTATGAVMIRIDDEYFVTFNRAIRINSGTREGRNQVLIHQRGNAAWAFSSLLAELTAGSTFNLQTGLRVVPVKVISIGDNARVEIGDVGTDCPPGTKAVGTECVCNNKWKELRGIKCRWKTWEPPSPAELQLAVNAWCSGSADTTSFQGTHISRWNVRKIESMANLFQDITSCPRGLGGLKTWKPIRVRTMQATFKGCTVLKGVNLSKWPVKQVRIFLRMFEGAVGFTAQGLQKWQPIRATNFNAMFRDAQTINPDFKGWVELRETLNPTPTDVAMFTNARPA